MIIAKGKIMIGVQDDHKQHFETLDLLRGIAAICVVLFHFSSRVEYGGIFYHGYLAVDFFFCLSGYVIFQAYYSKLATSRMNVRRFFIIRVIRFLPLVLLGNIVAAITDLFRPGDYELSAHIIDIIFVLVFSSFLLPTLYKTSLEQTTYPLNGPVWSLFFEMIANILFSLLAKLRFFWPTVFCICAVSLVLLIKVSLIKGDIHVGPHIEFFLYAFPRVFFSFFVGILLHNIKHKIRGMNWWQCSSIIICIFLVPKIQNIAASALFDFISITILFPFVVYSGANHLGAAFENLSLKSGELSYPLYAIHYPLVRVFSVLMRYFNFSVITNILISLILTAILAIFSLILFRLYDKPIRDKINDILESRRSKFALRP